MNTYANTEILPFSIMTKPAGPRCNITCEYCYYLEKEKLFPGEKKFRMSDAMLKTYIYQLIETSTRAGMTEVAFAWQGGEPTLLGIDYFRRIINLQKQYAPVGVKVTNTFQTNGTLLTDDWGKFLSDHGFLVGISIDGPKHIHDRYRTDRAGRPTFDTVMRGLEILQKHNVEYNVLCTVHRANGGKGKEIYRFLKSLGVEFMQFIPIIERRNGDLLAGPSQVEHDPREAIITEWSVAPRAYGKFLCDVFDSWFRHDIGKIFVQHFEVQLGLWMGHQSSLCVFAKTCGRQLVLEHDGSLYSCDHYVYSDYQLGNITETPLRDLIWTERQVAFGNNKAASLTAQCRSCEFRFACNGGCPKHRIVSSRDGEPGHNYFCESYTMFFRHAGDRLRRMAELVAAGYPAAEVSKLGVKKGP